MTRTAKRLNQNVYFASLQGQELLNELNARIEEYYQDLQSTGLFALMSKSYRAYYGARLTGSNFSGQLFDSSELRQGGKNGEIVHFKINHYRSLVKHTLQLATSTKTAFTCRATNTDVKSQAQAMLGNGLLDFYQREKKLEQQKVEAVENALVLLEGWIHCPWNPNKGEIYDYHPETGAPLMEGDLDFSVHTPLDVVRDPTCTNEHDWLALRTWENRFNLAARYPELSDRILSLSKERYAYEDLESFNFQIRRDRRDTDFLPVWTFYHQKTDALKDGRVLMFVGDVQLMDGPTPYRRIPLHRVTPERLIGTPYGYSPAIDILGPQQALDILNSTILTNNAAYGTQAIWTKANDPITVAQLEGGMKNLMSEEMPQALQLTKSAPETLQFRQEIIGEMETIIGISATVRGNPEANLKSGSALALVVSQSIQFASMLEGSVNMCMEDVATDIIMQLRDFGKSDRVANIIGEANRPFQKNFSGDDLSQINRVIVEETSPLAKTVAGRVEMANDFLEKGLIENGKAYINVVKTGQLDASTEASEHDLLNQRAENEALRNGRPVMALITDLHGEHINEHRALLSSPEAREDPKLVSATLAHIQDHIAKWRGCDPAILFITGQQPPPPPPPQGLPPMGAPQGGQQGAPGQAPPAPGGGPAPGSGDVVPGPTDPSGKVQQLQHPTDSQMPGQPNMPSLPPGSPDEAAAAYGKVA